MKEPLEVENDSWSVMIDSDEIKVTYKDSSIIIKREDLEQYWSRFLE